MELNLHFFFLGRNARLSNLPEIQTSVRAIFHFGMNLIHRCALQSMQAVALPALENGANLLAAANCRRYDVSSAQSLYSKSS
jgi:hypothetical protein